VIDEVTPLHEAALRYLELGFHPVPVEPRGKQPLARWKDYQSRQPTRAEVNAWWTETPSANVALVLGRGVFAIDVDGIEGATSFLSSPDMQIPSGTPTSNTGKGRHYFLSAPGSVGDHIGLLPGIDVKGVGYVVVPPSIHQNGREYTWEMPLLEKPPMAPDSILALMQPAKDLKATTWVPAGVEWLLEALGPVGEGKRDVSCTRLAGYLLGKGIPPAATELILNAWAARCTPPFSPRDVRKCVESISHRETPSTLGLLSEHLRDTYAKIGKAQAVRATGLKELDKLLGGGFYPGELIYFGARPKMGKTTIALQIARHVASQGYGVLFVSLEMSPGALTRRMLAQESGVPASVLKSGHPTEMQWDLLSRAMDKLNTVNIQLRNDIHSSSDIEDVLRALEPSQVGFLVVDYLQLLYAPETKEKGRLSVEAVSQHLRMLSLKHKIPILAISSLSRAPREAGSKWGVKMSDLRESGALEFDADIILGLDVFPEGGEHSRKLEILANRDGEPGNVYLTMTDSLRFE
jgi:KaiC/GvpD/RAD55 family RecA-like ATPase